MVEFRVTTLDVNHGFSLYAPDGHLVAQTQAMPGYVNRLRVTFDQPGTYTVLCLEFCGMSHHRMRGVVEVDSRRRNSDGRHIHADSPTYTARLTRLTLVWVLTALVLFPVLAVLGLLMRTLQGDYFRRCRPSGSTR